MDDSAPATEASLTRRRIAGELVQGCRDTIGREIAITGSVARGHADRWSDIEINIWVDEVASAREREAWLCAAGVQHVELWDEPLPDGSLWATADFQDVKVEIGWQTRSALEGFLQPLLAAEDVAVGRCVVAAALAEAVPLRTDGFIPEWQQRLSLYPEPLRRRIIASTVFPWKYPFEHETLARRGERIALAERQIRELHRILRVLFALNGQWEPDWKWAASLTSRLATKPEGLIGRMEGVLSTSDLVAGVQMMLELIADTLDLLPPAPAVDEARCGVEEALGNIRV